MSTKKKILIAVVFIVVVALGVCAAIFIPQSSHKHEVGDIMFDDSGHWYVCANECEKLLDENGVELSAPIPHDFSGEVVYLDNNKHAYKCVSCECVGINGVVNAAEDCDLKWAKEGPNSLEGIHYKECSICKHIDESSRNNHMLYSTSPNHTCSVCELVNVFEDAGEPNFHYFLDGLDTACSIEGCDAFLQTIQGSKNSDLWPWGKYLMVENGCDEEHGCISCDKYFLKTNYIPYKNSSGSETWHSTPIMIIQGYVHGDYTQHYEKFIEDIKEQYPDDTTDSGIKELIANTPTSLFTSDASTHMNWYDSDTGIEYEWGSSIISYSYGSGWLPQGNEIAVAPSFDSEKQEWVFDLSVYKGHYLIKRIENVLGISDGIYIGELFKNGD